MKTNPHQEKGKEIAKRQDIIRVSGIHYRVHSQTTNREYDVIRVGENSPVLALITNSETFAVNTFMAWNIL